MFETKKCYIKKNRFWEIEFVKNQKENNIDMSNVINRLFEGDCLEYMKEIPDGSVDMILCDLPYGMTQNLFF